MATPPFPDPELSAALSHAVHDGRLLWALLESLPDDDFERLASFCWFFRRERERPKKVVATNG